MENKLTQGNIAKSLLIFTIPFILSGMFQQVFNWVDAFIVGNVEGEIALAGIGAVTSIYNLFVTVIIGFTSGISVLAAQQFGKNEKEKLKNILSIFVVLLGSIFIVTAILGILFASNILTILNTPVNIFRDAKKYMQLLLIGIPFLAIYNTYSAILRGLGNSKAPFLSVIICSGINVVLDILFVIFFRFGTAGAAAATAISQMAMTIFIVIYAIKKYPMLRFRLNKKILNKSIIIQGLRFSMPPAVQAGTTSIGNIVLQRFMNSFGEVVVVAITTAYRVDSVILLPIVNFGSGIATIVAQNVGANKMVRAKKVLKIGSIIITFVSICLTIFVIVTGSSLIKMFGLTQEAVEIGNTFFYTIASFYVVYGLSMAMRGYIEGTGDMLFSGSIVIFALVVRIVLSYILVPFFDDMVIAYAEAFSWIVLLVLYSIRLFFNQKQIPNI